MDRVTAHTLDIIAVLKQLGLTSGCHFVGTSLGYLVVMLLPSNAAVLYVALAFILSTFFAGAFGLVVRWMKTHREYLCQYPLKTQLDLAFRHAVDPNGAYYCFRNCGYVAPFAFPGS